MVEVERGGTGRSHGSREGDDGEVVLKRGRIPVRMLLSGALLRNSLGAFARLAVGGVEVVSVHVDHVAPVVVGAMRGCENLGRGDEDAAARVKASAGLQRHHPGVPARRRNLLTTDDLAHHVAIRELDGFV